MAAVVKKIVDLLVRYALKTDLDKYMPLSGGVFSGAIALGRNYLYGEWENGGAIIYFTGNKVLVGSTGSKTTSDLQLRTRKSIEVNCIDDGKIYTLLHSGNINTYVQSMSALSLEDVKEILSPDQYEALSTRVKKRMSVAIEAEEKINDEKKSKYIEETVVDTPARGTADKGVVDPDTDSI